MLIFWKERLVILAVPKTGTSAYARALGPRADIVVREPPELKHAPLRRYNRFFHPMLDKMGAGPVDIMAVVRHPVDWLGSWYRYRQRPFLAGKDTSTAGLSFDAFVADYCRGDQPAHAHVGSQSRFLAPKPDGVTVTHLFQYEDQPRILSFLVQRLGHAIDLEQENVSPAASLTLSQELEDRLRRKYAADFDLWEQAGATPPER
ncbi:gamma-glutamyl kinase [Mesobacterium sp. TK19101]|uniref:Gamma-glutamyl kinase n=1 Tax=Mesobacterium hydrothermale TaxID=3111907 RepID=A0ABU6HIB7_9RHOB|nr:gamma-glutamyl kinase [Mesobacterium sp. TK19101]MEC3862132.1 gamma-glutamyl kinase [Mesobacterium sp. TK19101]